MPRVLLRYFMTWAAKTCSKYFFFHTRSCIALLHWCIQHRLPYPHSCSRMLHSQPDSCSLLMSRLLLTSVRRGRWRVVSQSSPSSKNSNRVIISDKVIEKLSVSFSQLESQRIASPSLKYYSHLLHYISTRFSHISRCLTCICWSMTEILYWAVKWQAKGRQLTRATYVKEKTSVKTSASNILFLLNPETLDLSFLWRTHSVLTCLDLRIGGVRVFLRRPG